MLKDIWTNSVFPENLTQMCCHDCSYLILFIVSGGFCEVKAGDLLKSLRRTSRSVLISFDAATDPAGSNRSPAGSSQEDFIVVLLR